MAAIAICSDFGAQKNKVSHCFHCCPSICMKWWEQMPWSLFSECWALSQLFHSPLSPSSRGSLVPLCFLPLEWYHVHILGCCYFSIILITVCDSSSPAFRMMYSAYKLNKQNHNRQPCCTPFPVLNQSVVPCPVLTVASWPSYRFLRRKIGCLVFPSF